MYSHHRAARAPGRAAPASPVAPSPQYADFAATAILVLTSVGLSLGTMLRVQWSRGELPYWLCAAYNFAWVGFGGRVMGAAYTFAHKEVIGPPPLFATWPLDSPPRLA